MLREGVTNMKLWLITYSNRIKIQRIGFKVKDDLFDVYSSAYDCFVRMHITKTNNIVPLPHVVCIAVRQLYYLTQLKQLTTGHALKDIPKKKMRGPDKLHNYDERE